ncbi:MAG TPA: 3-phosphoshikimate 1-carboxyvinyltransferase, partial [Gemmatimonadales bacterium]|nr:3-phosphoshikimate 1-carboxyvinyltransferase [Gemmatimonadales bacterium]
LRAPARRLHCGNSGTTARLLLGALAGHAFPASLTGDASLRRRPMRRVIEPLEGMGAHVSPTGADHLPVTIRGGRLRPITWELPVSSAQLKGALLLAGVTGGVEVSVREPAGRSRDHSERMLRSLGYEVAEPGDGWIRFRPTGRLAPFEAAVPGDPSSAAFLLAAGLLRAMGSVRLAAVGINPTRTGFLRVLARMGARIEVEDGGEVFGEPTGTLVARGGPLRGAEVPAGEIPGLIDEVPVLAALASRARGETVFREVGELRVKESDRLALVAANLRAIGAGAEVQGEDLVVAGGMEAPPRGRVRTAGDHRLAMAFGVLGTLPGARVGIDDRACAAVSFPGFWDLLREATR